MNSIKLTALAISSLALTACGGSDSGGADPVEGVDFVASTGVIEGLELPTADELAELPAEIGETVNQFAAASANNEVTSTLPPGDALFVGPWAMGEIDDGNALAGGTMSLDVNFDGAFITGRMDMEYIYDDDGNRLTITANPLEVFDIDVFGEIVDGSLTGNINGRFDVEGETTTVGGTFDGEFYGENADGAVGTIAAVTGYPDGGQDGFDGIFQIESQ